MAHLTTLPGMPEIGQTSGYYKTHIHEAERFRDAHSVEAVKVGMYVTRAMQECETWAEKEKCLTHALHRHCVAPEEASEEVREFYGRLAHLVREHAGQEALRYASKEDDEFARRLARGEPWSVLARDARVFFHSIIPHAHRPDWLNLEDFNQLKILRNSWDHL